MDKRASLRRFYTDQDNQKKSDSQHELQLKKLDAVSTDIVSAIGVLIRFLDGKTSKTEVVNQLKSISTPDVDKVVTAVSKLDKDILANKLDLQPLVKELQQIKREMSLVPKTLPKLEQRDSFKVSNLDEVSLDTKDLEKAIRNLKLDPKIEVKPAAVHTAPVDLKPLKDGLLDVLKAIKAQKYPEFPTIEPTDLTKLEKESKKHTKLLTEIKDKPVGGSGGGGNGTPYIDGTGKPVNVELDSGSVPVSVTGGATEAKQDDIIAAFPLKAGTDYDYQSFTNTDTDEDTVVSKTGGSSGTTVQTLVITYAPGADKFSDVLSELEWS